MLLSGAFHRLVDDELMPKVKTVEHADRAKNWASLSGEEVRIPDDLD